MSSSLCFYKDEKCILTTNQRKATQIVEFQIMQFRLLYFKRQQNYREQIFFGIGLLFKQSFFKLFDKIWTLKIIFSHKPESKAKVTTFQDSNAYHMCQWDPMIVAKYQLFAHFKILKNDLLKSDF